MRRLFASLFTLAFLTATPALAVMEDYPSAKLQGLDKSVGRTVTFEAKVGSTIQYGPLFIKIHACRKAPPIEKPESAAFLQIWEVPPGQEKSEWVFSGWMFASSPALSAMDHPVYDVWVIDCLGKEEPNAAAAEAVTTKEDADQTDLEPVDETAVPDSEAEDQTPVAETPATDSEAEEQPAVAENTPVDAEAEEQSPQGNAGISDPGPAPETALDPQTQIPPADPSTDPGFTVYDMIKQGGGKVQLPVQNGQNP